MFLICSDVRRLGKLAKNTRATAFGRPEVSEVAGWGLLVINDGFTTAGSRGGHHVVARRRPGIDREPVSGIEWRAESSIRIHRRWSGEFAIYYTLDPTEAPLLVASHLKLVAMLEPYLVKRMRRLDPGREVVWRRRGNRWIGREVQVARFASEYRYDFTASAGRVRGLVHESVGRLPDNTALLLSGGIDSSAVAAAACHRGKKLHAFTFATARELEPHSPLENDRLCAARVAEYLGVPFTVLRIPPQRLVANLPLAVYLAETSRGTIIDDCVAWVDVAQTLRREGFRYVVMGEAADDLFGGFKFALRYYRAQQLRKYYRQQLVRELPNEMAIIQNMFAPWGISVIQPFWTEPLMRLGYNLPLRFRIDQRQLLKTLVREAFRGDLPEEIVTRPKCATRDGNGVRRVLEQAFGSERERYRATYNQLLRSSSPLPASIGKMLRAARLARV